MSVITERHLEQEMQVTVTPIPTTLARVTIIEAEHLKGRTHTWKIVH